MVPLWRRLLPPGGRMKPLIFLMFPDGVGRCCGTEGSRKDAKAGLADPEFVLEGQEFCIFLEALEGDPQGTVIFG
jgi:hypothetical protein